MEQYYGLISSGADHRALDKAPFQSSTVNDMLEGGIPVGSTTVLLGPSGAGKTLLGLDFLTGGARRGEPCLYVGFHEAPRRLSALADRIGLGFSRHVDDGTILIEWQVPLDGLLDKMALQILRAVTRQGTRRLFIDGLDAIRSSALYPERISRVFAALVSRLRELGVTTILSEELPLFSLEIETPISDVSAVMENAILLRYVEVHSRLCRLISIVKVRGSSYDTSIRQFCITDEGVSVASSFESAEAILTGGTRAPAPARATTREKKRRPRRRD